MAITNEQRIDAMIALLRNMKTDDRRLIKLSAVSCMDLTPKKAQQRNADADWIAMENIKRRHELHALSVELGFAERRSSYEPIELRDNWHRFKYTPRAPA
jgi:hypothetical protein